MALISKPNYKYIWAVGGDIVEPTDLKKQQGWTAEVPPFQYENWIQNRQDQYLAHINQRGIPAWDGGTEYEAGGLSYVQGSDGKIYKSVAASGPTTTVQDPTTDASDTYWKIAFSVAGEAYTKVESDARYMQGSNNLSEITNQVTARTNLGAVSDAQVDAKFTGTNASLAGNGYQKLPSGLIIQWATVTTNASGVATATLPIAFPNAILKAFLTPAGANSVATIGVSTASTVGVNCYTGHTGAGKAENVSLIAIGY